MTERLIALALRFRVAVIAITLLLVGVGVWALGNLNVDAFPDLTPNQVQVITVAPGLSPNEVENLVSYPMETAMMGLPRTRGVRSISKAGISVVTVSYDDDVDMYFARAQVTQRMQDATGNLPAGVQSQLGPPATPMGEVFQYLVESDSLSLMELKNVQEYTVKPMLRTIPGVADVNSWGGMVQQFHVLADPSKLAGYNLTLSDLKSRNNSKSVATPRQISMYLCKSLTHASLPEIGRSFGGKHHSTVIHSIRKIEELRKREPDFNSLMSTFLEAFK